VHLDELNLCMFICIYMYIHIYTYTHTHTHTHTYYCVCLYVHICTYIYIHTHTHTHTHTHILLAQGLKFIITRAGGVGALGRAEPVCDTYTHTHTHTHTLQEALVHLEELKLREIAQERAMHMNNNLLTTKRIAENHRNRSLLTH
jgi:hypothetical protein